ncbi:MAG: peptidase M12 [Acidobacteria bacterium]|nr:peptidase M12 [Acidobacteriota bacterium]
MVKRTDISASLLRQLSDFEVPVAAAPLAANVQEHEPADIGCAVKQLPHRMVYRSAEVAARVNPANGPVVGPAGVLGEEGLPSVLAAAVVTSKYWGPTPRKLTVSFLDGAPADLRRKIVSHMNAWTKTGCIEFVETSGVGQVRITRGGSGYWSYLGTDILLIPTNRPTMNLQNFSMSTPDREYRRVVRHETGHTLGMPHEHMRKALVDLIDKKKAYEYFRLTQGWPKETVDQQVLTPLDELTLMFTPPDQDSIMCYQLPGSITKSGKPIRGGLDINETDYKFIGQIYPKPGAALEETSEEDEWSEDDDVKDPDY